MSLSNGQRDRCGWRILIAGTGGQGVLTAARLLCDYFVTRGHDVVSSQLHNMAQRGGAVQSSVIVDGGVSPVIPAGRAGFVVGFEPVETVRAIPFMSSRTLVFMNTVPVIPCVLAQETISQQGDGDYPDVQALVRSIRAITANVVTLDATKCATKAGSSKAMNMVMLGCLFASGALPFSAEAFLKSAAGRIPEPLRKVNTHAFQRGIEFVHAPTVGAEAQ